MEIQRGDAEDTEDTEDTEGIFSPQRRRGAEQRFFSKNCSPASSAYPR